ncbi:MAG: lipoprotein signal peptidase [Rhodocyclaceae bacterium]|nr:lipoprotein signal peptidase [Rhodocyclaceae bacterium]
MPAPDGRASPARWYALAALVVALDQITKQIALATIGRGETIYVAPFWNWVLTFNPGASFSFLADAGGWQRWLFTALALAVSGWIAFMLRGHAAQKLLAFALALIMGGALGNVIDRVRFGAVVDFVQWHAAGFYWPAFNVADSAIVVGAVLMVLDQFRAGRRKKERDSDD